MGDTAGPMASKSAVRTFHIDVGATNHHRSWILAVCTGKKVGAFLSDISGAFDRVFKPYILAKLHACGVGTFFLNFLDAYLTPRKGQVVVQGSYSDCFEIANSVFQGTVLGPPLWNTFFADVGTTASSNGVRQAPTI